MKKIITALAALSLSLSFIWAQEISDFSDDALFSGSDDDFFTTTDSDFFGGTADDDLFSGDSMITGDDNLFGGDDDFFGGSGIEVVDITKKKSSETTDLSHGILFQNGSIKIGGRFDTSVSTLTALWADDDLNLGEHIYESTFTPSVSAYLTVDARPKQNLRMYTKFGFAYPFKSTGNINLNFQNFNVTTTITDFLKVKELFTDFSIKDRVFFRFGLHTVTWGTGYFYSPVSDVINTSSINPEDVTAQVNGSLNLRTQIVIPGSQNCFWFYVVPSTKFNSVYTLDTYLRDTALAGKVDLVFGGWEFGLGAFYKYQNAPKAMLTASGSLWKINLFGEFLYRYGADSEWEDNKDWQDKTSIFQTTVGIMYMWKKPSITLVAQYYYDSNDKDMLHQYVTKGNNLALAVNFGKLFGTSDVTAAIFGMANFNKDELSDQYKTILSSAGISSSLLSSVIVSGLVTWKPFDIMSFTAGPYITWETLDSTPVISLKLSATLGGGKF